MTNERNPFFFLIINVRGQNNAIYKANRKMKLTNM